MTFNLFSFPVCLGSWASVIVRSYFSMKALKKFIFCEFYLKCTFNLIYIYYNFYTANQGTFLSFESCVQLSGN